MVAYNFKAQFADAIAAGRKQQTIRAIGLRRHAAVGKKLQLYTGQRTKGCRKIVEPDPTCIDVQSVEISETKVVVDGSRLSLLDELKLARADGFSTVEDFRAFFAERLPFEGVLIK